MNKEQEAKIKDIWTQWITKDIRQLLAFPKALLATFRVLDGGA